MTIGDIIDEPMRVHKIVVDPSARKQRVFELLNVCGLKTNFADRYPHEMSGGQRQRVGIARALAMNPEFIICDEAVSALDVTIKAQVINLLMDLQSEFNLSYLFISHDMAVVERISHRVAVMYLGRIVEIGSREAILKIRPMTTLRNCCQRSRSPTLIFAGLSELWQRMKFRAPFAHSTIRRRRSPTRK